MGGGSSLSEGYTDDLLQITEPLRGAAGTPTSWYVVYIAGSHPSRTVTAYALCVSP